MRPWGEQLVQPFYDRHEPAYPIVDNVTEEGAGTESSWPPKASPMPATTRRSWLRYFLSKTSWPQFRLDLDGGNAPSPTWDIAKVRGIGPDFSSRRCRATTVSRESPPKLTRPAVFGVSDERPDR